MPAVGSLISLISKTGIRYQGSMYTVDLQDSTIALRHGERDRDGRAVNLSARALDARARERRQGGEKEDFDDDRRDDGAPRGVTPQAALAVFSSSFLEPRWPEPYIAISSHRPCLFRGGENAGKAANAEDRKRKRRMAFFFDAKRRLASSPPLPSLTPTKTTPVRSPLLRNRGKAHGWTSGASFGRDLRAHRVQG